MKINLSGTGVIATAAILSGVAAAAWLLVQFGPKLKRLATKTLNPASSENIVNQGVGAVVSDVVGYEESLGGAIADKVFKWRHPNFRMSGPSNDEINPAIPPPRGYYDLGQKPAPWFKPRGYYDLGAKPVQTPDGDLHDGTSSVF